MLRLKSKLTLIVVIIVLVIGLVGGFLLYSNHNKTQSAQTAKSDKKDGTIKPSLSVSVVLPQTIRLPLTIAANGNVAAWQEASIGSESNGLRITDVRVNVGDSVRKGQILATYAAETIQADVAQSEANLLQTEALAAQDYANAERALKLDAEGALSKQDISLYVTNAKAAKAKVEAAKATVNAQKIRLKFTTVLSPDDGIISARSATVGAVVNGGAELFRIIRQSRLEWRAEVTSNEINHVHIGDSAKIQSDGGASVTGRVRMIAPTVDPLTRMALVYVDLPVMQSASSPIKSGMYARGVLDTGTSNAITLPQASVVMRDGFNYIFALTPNNRVKQIKVQTGRSINDQTEITTSIPADSKIVVAGASFLNDGDLVRVISTQAINSSIAAH